MLFNKNNATAYDRYPEIFGICQKYFNGEQISILSFGCSTGQEVRTLNDIYFPGCRIDGVDYCDNVSESPNIEYFLEMPDRKYDLIFCMSVLLTRYEHDEKLFKFEEFEKQVAVFDAHLNTGGLLVIYNANYRFCDTAIAKKYHALHTTDAGFVPVFTPEKEPTTYNDCIFIKK